jgi:hypothetical protein
MLNATWQGGQCLDATWFNLGGHCLNVTWHLPNQKYQSKWLVKNVNLSLVKKFMAQSQWIGSKQLVRND